MSPTTVYILGRQSSAIAGHWKKLSPIAHIERTDLTVERRHRGPVLAITLTDKTTGTALEFEARAIGNLGVKDLLASLEG